ncbi:RidA family protein [Campylobacter sp. IFREMER_LSEM_CL2127]|uniref:RidA family protein n=1 Tax=Campylobacter lari TaxID=201 RepID=A0A7M1ML35_CAMLA|nr:MULTISPECIES: RidA family protein [unclassified Campylobacter]EAI5466800.1 RidA family protein [Campylobacter lari]MCR8712160.1 RidA family protein [Campylobacter sp. W0066.1]EDP6893284.1 RidA family protein [Campylobacter lari]MCV3381805.1 RidA family protein [Campylobacter sp. IFREMER_LSEM_CL2127]MCV3397259.1 RidA family protein [Campylobacter sp. RKI_CA19_01116]
MSSKIAVKTKLFPSKSPLEWAVVSNNILYTAQIPIDKNGEVVTGGIEAQTKQVFSNLIHTLECAGSKLDDVLQILIYVTKREDLKFVNSVYSTYFNTVYPNRAAFIVSGLAREEMLVEFVVYAQTHN